MHIQIINLIDVPFSGLIIGCTKGVYQDCAEHFSKPTQVEADFICYVLHDIACDILPQYHDRTLFAKMPHNPTTPAQPKPSMLTQTFI